MVSHFSAEDSKLEIGNFDEENPEAPIKSYDLRRRISR